jgi:hypothetical protein
MSSAQVAHLRQNQKVQVLPAAAAATSAVVVAHAKPGAFALKQVINVRQIGSFACCPCL